MLVLGRKVGEWIQIGEWTVHVLRVKPDRIVCLVLHKGRYVERTRLLGEAIELTTDTNVTVCCIEHGKVSLGITAPKDVLILRGELT